MQVPSNKSINIDELKQNTQTIYKLKVGGTISFKTKIHASVGLGAEYEFLDNKVVKLEDSKIIYDNPNFEGVGGDAAMQKFTFKGLLKGKTEVTIKKMYRGNLEKEIVLEIEVI
jgi:hypothetical protein